MDHVLRGFLVGLVGFVLEKSPFPPMLRKAKFQRQKQELSDSLEESERKMQISSTSPSIKNMPLKKGGLAANSNRNLKTVSDGQLQESCLFQLASRKKGEIKRFLQRSLW